VLDTDVADAMPGIGSSWWRNLADAIPPERRERIASFQARQTPKAAIWERARSWLARQDAKPGSSTSTEDWRALAEAVYWAGRLRVSWPLSTWLTVTELNRALESLPIEALSEVILGLWSSYKEEFASWLEESRPRLATRFREETQTWVLEDDGTKLTAHFVIAAEQEAHQPEQAASGTKRLHEAALKRITILSRLFPDRDEYACQGYGHNLWGQPLPVDDTVKTGVARSRLPPLWLTSVNSTFRGLAELSFRPATWQEYAEAVFVLRQTAARGLERLEQALSVYFMNRTPTRLAGNLISGTELRRYCLSVRNRPLLPSPVVDEW